MLTRVLLNVIQSAGPVDSAFHRGADGRRQTLDHGLSIRAAENANDLTRGLAGYVTTYQGIAAAPTPDADRQVLREVGNLSSASVLVVLERYMRERRPPDGSYSILAAMGPGFCAELVLLRW